MALGARDLKSNFDHDEQGSAWIDVAIYAGTVFRTLDRRSVLGYTLCGSKMRLWHTQYQTVSLVKVRSGDLSLGENRS